MEIAEAMGGIQKASMPSFTSIRNVNDDINMRGRERDREKGREKEEKWWKMCGNRIDCFSNIQSVINTKS